MNRAWYAAAAVLVAFAGYVWWSGRPSGITAAKDEKAAIFLLTKNDSGVCDQLDKPDLVHIHRPAHGKGMRIFVVNECDPATTFRFVGTEPATGDGCPATTSGAPSTARTRPR